MITIQLNGQKIQLPKGVTLKVFLNQNNLANNGGVAVALNQSVVAQSDWEEKELKNNDEIIIITATQGG
ncbi:MAG: sulfur carrier protein ThiS [Flavobacteriales bacterium]|jgi:sulfur carrier protein|nr:sulfur carrier protein ThiS [Flavobacteriales bacterium]